MKIFRLENQHGGPFRGDDGGSLCVEECYARDSHPVPSKDGLADYMTVLNRRFYRFGCDSMEQLRSWFNAIVVNAETENLPAEEAVFAANADHKDLHGRGFYITVYEVPDNECHYGDSLRQLMFPMDKANKVEYLPLSELFHG